MTVLVRDQIADLLRAALQTAQADQSLPEFSLPPIELARPKVATHGDYASNVAMALAKVAKLPPLKIAETIVAHLPAAEFLGKTDIAAPGYINFTLSEAWLDQQVTAILEGGSTWANLKHGNDVRVQVEHGSANPTGPITVGSARNVVIGDTIANLLNAAGYDVQREYYVNDAGSQIRHFGESLYARYAQTLGHDEAFPEDGYQGAYIKDVAEEIIKERSDAYLKLDKQQAIRALGQIGIERMVASAQQTLLRVNIRYDRWFHEKSLYDSGLFDRVVELLRAQDLLYEKDDATWFKAAQFGADKDAVLIRSPKIIANPDERPTYFASDCAYMHDKFLDRKFDRVVYVWGADHHGELPRMSAIRQVYGLKPEQLVIVIYQLITLVRSGEEVRQSKRTGDFITLDELIDEIGPDPIRFMLLTRTIDSKIVLDLDLAKEQSDKNPVYYVQYAHARIASILRKASEALTTVELPRVPDVQLLKHPAELALIRRMLELPVIIDQAVRDLAPHHLTYYAQDLASTFSTFYRDCKVIDAEQSTLTAARLQLCRAAKITLARTLELMGMSAPESM
ncbi:MAG TPA: arginine--tRNA ligase [Anaerolineae bacterium]|nr:arginine--tRNA ligase [Anaerolineae bacterium]